MWIWCWNILWRCFDHTCRLKYCIWQCGLGNHASPTYFRHSYWSSLPGNSSSVNYANLKYTVIDLDPLRPTECDHSLKSLLNIRFTWHWLCKLYDADYICDRALQLKPVHHSILVNLSYLENRWPITGNRSDRVWQQWLCLLLSAFGVEWFAFDVSFLLATRDFYICHSAECL